MNTFTTVLQRQKKLIIIFLLTIVLPSAVLSIFGIMAIRNEKYRRDQQNLNEQQQIVTLLKRQFSSQFKNVETILQNTAQLQAFHDRDYRLIQQHLNAALIGNTVVDQVFILFEDGVSFFPLLQSSPDVLDQSDPILNESQEVLLTQAWKAEFTDNHYETAISLYQELVDQTAEYDTKLMMLNHLARVQKKSGKIAEAIQTYERIIGERFSSLTSNRLPIPLTANIQIIDCERISGRKSQALEKALSLYNSILGGEWCLTQNQYLMYAEMTEQVIQELLSERPVDENNQEQYDIYRNLREIYQKRVEQWKIRKLIETEIVPILKTMTSRSESETFHFSREVQGEDILITAVPLAGLICVKWNNDRLIHGWLEPIVDNLLLGGQFKINMMDLSGEALLGDESSIDDAHSVTGEFDDYFPPWKIEVIRTSSTQSGIHLYESYYFWSILILLIILVFGALLIIRTLVHEREVMAVKSEFVSSVSHELKTPLTSIKALTERLLEGKVKSKEKMHHYFTVIDQDANRLTRLVKNILDFSKMEAGKKEYHFKSTDITSWLNETIDDFSKDHIHDHIEINTHFDPDIPTVAIDRDALSQCVYNLLDNAIKFSPKLKTVDVHLNKTSGFIRIGVKDQGVGIPKEDLNRVFEKFYQGRSSVRDSIKGTGLGLALVKHTLEAHGGRVELKSSPGNGSTFTLNLPIVNPNC